MSERKAKAARKAARERGEHTVAPIHTKGSQLWPQWPNRRERRHPGARP